MNRADWQALAEERLLAAHALLLDHQWSSAYYLAGYAVEFGLKSCVLVRVTTSSEVIFDDKKYSEKCWTHNLEDLIKLAGLETARDADSIANPAFGANWLIVKDWNEKSRYQQKSAPEAQRLYDAIADNMNGVMPWIRVRW